MNIYKVGRIKVDLKGWLNQFIEGFLRPLSTKSAHKAQCWPMENVRIEKDLKDNLVKCIIL